MRRLIVIAAVLLAFVATPSASAGPQRLLNPFAGRKVVELKAPKPAWFTDALAAQVHAAGPAGMALPAGAAVPASALAFTGIRPGSWMLSPSGCTLNFVFGANTHVGVAGHCTSPGDRVTIVAAPGILMEIGTTVLSHDNGIGDDFALIAVDAAMQQYVNPSMAYFGGPTAVGDPAVGDVVVYSGHGLVIGTGGTPRVAVVTYRGPGDGGDAFGWTGAAAPGDSGAAVRGYGGLAAGDLTHLVVGTDYLPAVVVGTTAARMQLIAGMPIATAPFVPDPLY